MASPIGEMVYKIVGDNSQFDSAIDKSDAKFKSFSQIVAKSAADIQSSFKQIEGEAAVWGQSVDLIKQKQDLLKNEISNLIAQGIDPLDDKIEKLQSQYFDLGKEAEELSKKQKSFNDKLGDFSNKAISMGKGLTLGVTTPLIAMGVAAVRSSATMEMLQASFTTMLGSATKATVLMQQLKDMASVTPFETTDLADASKTLLQFGVSSEKLLPTLQMLGDIAQGNGQKFNSLALVFGQMSSAGRLMGQDLLQMINAGFNPLKVISEQTGESMALLKDKMSKGAISADQVTEAFKSATSQGGLFYKGMETASKTFDGLTSTLKDDIATMGRSFVQDLMPILKDVVKGLSSAAQWVTSLDSTTKTIILTMGGFAAAAGPVLLAVGGISKAILGLRAAALAAGTSIGAIMGPAGLVIGALAVLATGIALFASQAKKAKEDTEKLNSALDQTASLEAMQTELDKTRKKLENLYVVQKASPLSDNIKTQIEVLEAQKSLIERNIATARVQISQQQTMGNNAKEEVKTIKEEAEWLKARNKVVAEYEEKIAIINLELRQGSITEKDANDERQKALEAHIDDLNKIIVAYKLIPGETTKMATAAINDLNRLKAITRDIPILSPLDPEALPELKEYDAWLKENFIPDLEKANATMKAIPEFSPMDEEAVERADAFIEDYDVFLAKFKKERALEDALNPPENTDKWKEYANQVLTITGDLASQLGAIFDGIYQNQIDKLESETNAKLSANEEQLQSALEAAGLEDDTAIESAQKKLDAAIEANDAEAISEAQKALKKIKIEEDFALKEQKIKEDAAIKEHALRVKQFKADQAIQIAQVGMDVASGIIKIWSQAGINVVLGGILTGILAALGAAQIGVISAKQPPELQLGEGGIIPARTGGVNATLAEAGQTEVVFPLDKLENFINKGSVNNENMGNIELKVYMDSKPFLDTIFPATRNKTVLISAKAIVG